jgi:hypothetical protein
MESSKAIDMKGKLHLITAFLACLLLLAMHSDAYAQQELPLKLEILSSNTLNGTAGDYVTIEAQITNIGNEPLADITTYISLVDNENKLPVDLEDWSAEKGLFIGSIEAGQTLPLSWKIHFVKAGDYSLIVVADAPISDMPRVSRITHFQVAAKQNLNPGKVLPVALGMPIFLMFIMAAINYWRQKGSD